MTRAAKTPTRTKRGSGGAAAGKVVALTRQQLEDRAEQVARDLLHVSRARAFKLLDSGTLRGTLAEAALTPIRDMLPSSVTRPVSPEAEAVANIREAIVGCLEVRAEQGMPLTVKMVELDIAVG